MTEIKKLTINNWTLTHSRYVDDWGLEKDAFDLFDEATRTHRPFLAPMKVSNYKSSEPIKFTTDYTDEEYVQMLNDEIEKHD